MSRPKTPAIERFKWHFVVDAQTGCWNWTASLTRGGYGQFSLESGRIKRAPRVAYQLFKGPIPDGLVLDHLCRNRLCVNPDHLEPVTQRENSLRGESPWAQEARRTHCPKGHPYDEKNTYVRRGMRYCRICCNARSAAAHRRQRERERLARMGGAA